MSLKNINIIISFVSVILALISYSDAKAAPPTGFSDQQVTAGLSMPSDFAFTPDGRIFIIQLDGKVLIFKNNLLLTTPAIQIPVGTGGDRGLIGLTIDPNFSANQYIYFLYTSTSLHQRVSRFIVSGDTISPATETILLENPNTWGGFLNAGAIKFGPDGKLYASLGSNGEGASAQDLSSLEGKFLRINSDGTIPSDNPFFATPGAQKSIFAYGFRNPWRFNFSTDGRAILGDVGESLYEKIVRVMPAANYGWPNVEGDCATLPGGCGSYTRALYVVPHNGQGASVVGGSVYTADAFPVAYQNKYFFGDYVQGYLKYITFDGSGNVTQVDTFDTGLGALAGINNGTDGCLYYLIIFPGELQKICYGSQTLIAQADASPTYGTIPLTVQFSSTGSTDGSSTYKWNFGDGTTSTAANPSHTYTTKNVYSVVLTVKKGANSATANSTIWAGYTPPSVTISSPINDSNYNAGNSIHFDASATDAQDGTLPASNFLWRIIPHHNTHIHSPAEFNGIKIGDYVIPTNGEPGPDTWFEFEVTVTNSVGLTTTKSVNIFPNTAIIMFTSSPSGAQITIDGIPHITPHQAESVVGMSRTLSVPSPQTIGTTNYNFNSWSDAGAQTHTISSPATNTTYTATLTTAGGPLTFTDATTLDKTSYAAAETVKLTTKIRANQTISDLIIDTEIYNSAGTKILQNVVSANLTADVDFTSLWTFSAPSTGTYKIKVGVFTSDWSKIYYWNDSSNTLLVGSTPPPPPPPGPLTFTGSAMPNKTSYAGSEVGNITSTAKANQSVSDLILDTEVYNSTGTKVLQNVVSANFIANQDFTSVWSFTEPGTADSYKIKLGVFASDWSKIYYWNDTAGDFSVTTAPPPPPPPGGTPAFVILASMPSANFPAGASSTVTTKVSATEDVPNVIIDTEIHPATGGSAFSQRAVGTSLIKNQQFTTDWSLILPTQSGTYIVKVGVFSSDWSTLYFWKNNAFQFTIGTPPEPPEPGKTYPVNVIAPSDNSDVSGVVEIKAAIDELDINTYNIAWRTGSGTFFNLDTDPVTKTFKHTWINFDEWNWMPDNIYPLEFQATDTSGDIIGGKLIHVHVVH